MSVSSVVDYKFCQVVSTTIGFFDKGHKKIGKPPKEELFSLIIQERLPQPSENYLSKDTQ